MENEKHLKPGRGREAERPAEIPKRGWTDIAKRTLRGLSADNASIIAAGVAFYAFLSVPAIITALVSIYGLVSDPSQIHGQIQELSKIVPAEGLKIISDQLTRISSHTSGALTLSLIASIVFALWSGSNSIQAMIAALNIAYQEREKRGFFKLNAFSLLSTLAAIVGVVIAIVLVVGISAIVGKLDLPSFAKTWIPILRWPLLAVIALFGLSATYRYFPSRREPKWRWVSWGATTAAALWIIASALFSWYVARFGSYDKTYGSLAAIVVLLMWFYISSYVVILGAKLNAEMEHQTARDSTVGEPPKPMGDRGAKMADTLGESA